LSNIFVSALLHFSTFFSTRHRAPSHGGSFWPSRTLHETRTIFNTGSTTS
jgi:hypothetical protein